MMQITDEESEEDESKHSVSDLGLDDDINLRDLKIPKRRQFGGYSSKGPSFLLRDQNLQ